jgi:peptidoglycan/LPS O-acetylase OafA/YrhL
MSDRTAHERFEFIELLRFALALGVVIYHYYFWGPHEKLIRFAPIDGFGLGYLMFGVEAFFAVSGFVIVLSTAKRTPIEFFVARMARLGPTLLVASTVTLCAYYLIPEQPRISGIDSEYLHSISLLPLVRLGGGLDPSLWSLSFEIRFYLLIFVCMIFFDVQKHALKVAIGMLTYDAGRLLASHLFGHPIPSRLDLFRDYAPFFVIGILLYYRHAVGRPGPTWIAALAAAIALSCIRAFQELSRVNDLSLRLGPVHFWEGAAVACVIVTLMAVSVRGVRRPTLAAVFAVAGRASYPLYVVHQLCGYWLVNLCTERLHLHLDVRPIVLVVMVAASAVFGSRLEPHLIAVYRKSMTEASRVLLTTWSLAIHTRAQVRTSGS